MIKNKLVFLLLAACIVLACKTTPVNPEKEPVLTVQAAQDFEPDPDAADGSTALSIKVDHPVPIQEWRIVIQPTRSRPAGAQGAQQPARGPRAEGEGRQPRAEAEGEGGQPRQRQPFFEQSGTGKPPAEWKWNGRSTRLNRAGQPTPAASGEEYSVTLTVSDQFENTGTFEGTISTGMILRKDGDTYRMDVTSIVFPGNSADFSRLDENQMRGNRRVLNQVARALNKYPDYKVTIEGHANPQTPPNTPERTAEEAGSRNVIGLVPLSKDRAQAVVDYLATLENNSVDRSRLNAVGIGGENTVVEWDDAENNWQNRRVEFILHRE